MAGKQETKTNVMRVFEQKKIPYQAHCYADTGAISGAEVAEALHQDPNRAFKTLVTTGKSKTHYVFMIPVLAELDLKKAANVVGEKSIEMLKAKDLLGLTGYIHGGCSPIGMKKTFKTVIHVTAADYETIMFSAGKIGYQVELPLASLQKVLPVQTADLIVDKVEEQ